ncbi:MAG: DUF3795 domain-containing protein [Negativicutes bacterium]|nr:DUF3795 domain-containing protein [Negativicutes bacterium]
MSGEISRCGLDCGECRCRQSGECPGCYVANGQMFWGQCPVSYCCQQRGHDHCGLCPRYCCDMLYDFAYGEQGDNGRRLERLNQRLRDGS